MFVSMKRGIVCRDKAHDAVTTGADIGEQVAVGPAQPGDGNVPLPLMRQAAGNDEQHDDLPDSARRDRRRQVPVFRFWWYVVAEAHRCDAPSGNTCNVQGGVATLRNARFFAEMKNGI
tara:strand:- start:477 stop:830 length:354 start_codon:yes stop_codon:yes gene_type:complete